VIFPSVCIVFAAVAGGILAVAEGWAWVDGFVMVLGEATLTGITNPGTPPPKVAGGKIVAVFIAVIAQGIMGMTIALGSVPLLGFDLSFDKSPLKHVALWVFNSEQKGKLVGGHASDTPSDNVAHPTAAPNPPPSPPRAPLQYGGNSGVNSKVLPDRSMNSGRINSGGVIFSTSSAQGHPGTQQYSQIQVQPFLQSPQFRQ